MSYDSARKSDEDYRRENLNSKRRFKSAAVNRSVPTTGEEQEEDKDIRLPFILFTGPNDLYHHRLPQVDYRHEIGIGEASRLRTLDIRYLTRGKNVGLSRRHNLPGEIGWSAVYFNNSYASRSRGSSATSILSRPNSFYLPR